MESKLDTGKMKAPAFLMILTGVGDYVYRRKDGVCVELLRRGYDVFLTKVLLLAIIKSNFRIAEYFTEV